MRTFGMSFTVYVGGLIVMATSLIAGCSALQQANVDHPTTTIPLRNEPLPPTPDSPTKPTLDKVNDAVDGANKVLIEVVSPVTTPIQQTTGFPIQDIVGFAILTLSGIGNILQRLRLSKTEKEKETLKTAMEDAHEHSPTGITATLPEGTLKATWNRVVGP